MEAILLIFIAFSNLHLLHASVENPGDLTQVCPQSKYYDDGEGRCLEAISTTTQHTNTIAEVDSDPEDTTETTHHPYIIVEANFESEQEEGTKQEENTAVPVDSEESKNKQTMTARSQQTTGVSMDSRRTEQEEETTITQYPNEIEDSDSLNEGQGQETTIIPQSSHAAQQRHAQKGGQGEEMTITTQGSNAAEVGTEKQGDEPTGTTQHNTSVNEQGGTREMPQHNSASHLCSSLVIYFTIVQVGVFHY